eukprot:TRINITY_DN8420_c0_g1_i1.p2 TRINITY_DN8420_c0_g1~~TRINITY_DN8420_c0_g1_i1.p2  ORF type:complete len:192 (+),score=25.04 TRINITY_DN8420_c0_g1_i1:146-721(+)
MASLFPDGTAGPHTNTSQRARLNTRNPDFIQVMHRAKIDPRYKNYLCCIGICIPCSCMCCLKDQVYESTYVQIHENRLEFNYPVATSLGGLCWGLLDSRCCAVKDNVHVLYWDHWLVSGVGRAGCCTPACTHCSFFPTCCDICGQGVIFHDTYCPCWRHFMLGCIQDADLLVQHALNAKQAQVIIVTTPAV